MTTWTRLRGRKRRKASDGNRRGLSLLEVILAMAILGGSLAVLGELVRVGTRAAFHARHVTRAQILADSLMEEIVLGILPAESANNVAAPSYDQESPYWKYDVDVQQVEGGGLLAVQVTVHQDPTKVTRPVSYSLVRWMIDPLLLEELAAGGTGSGTADTSGANMGGDPTGGTR